MKNVIVLIFLFQSFAVSAQSTASDDDLEISINKLKYENRILKSDIKTINSKLSEITSKLDSLQRNTVLNSDNITQKSSELGNKIILTSKSNEEKILAVDNSLSKKSLYGIIGILIAILASGSIYWFLNKQQKIDKLDFIEKLNKTKSGIEEGLVKEFGKQTELMDTQIQLINQQKQINQNAINKEPDHSLALKVASEINLIERNINLMDSKTKGLKQIQESVKKLRENLSANGYEIPEHLGKKFNQGMKVIVAISLPDENIEKDTEIITKVLIPQVNYNDKMIQTAQIEVSVGV